MNHPQDGEIYILEHREDGNRLLAVSYDGLWQSMGSDFTDINDWCSKDDDWHVSHFKIIAHVDTKELKFTEVSLD